MSKPQGLRLPRPATFFREAVSTIGHPRVRCRKADGQAWRLNYSLIELSSSKLEEKLDEWLQALISASAPLKIQDLDITIMNITDHENGPADLDAIIYEKFQAFTSLADTLLRRDFPDLNTVPIYLSWTESLPAEVDLGFEDFRAYELIDSEDDITDAFWSFSAEFESWASGLSDIHVTYKWQRKAWI